MNTDTQLALLDRDLKDAKQRVDLGKALDRLMANRDFRKVIVEGYLEKEAVRLVHLKADPSMQAADKQAGIIRDIDAIGSLAEYFNTVSLLASRGVKEVEDGDAARERILEGDD